MKALFNFLLGLRRGSDGGLTDDAQVRARVA